MVFKPETSKDVKPSFTNFEVVAKRVFIESQKKLQQRKDKAERELEQIELDRRRPQINFDPRYTAEYRQQKNQRNKARAVGALAKSLEPGEVNPDTFAEHERRQTYDDQATEVAEDFLRASWTHYKIMRDAYIANVLTQVIERHFLVDICNVAPKVTDFDERGFKALVMDDRGIEEWKEQLSNKIEVLKKCLNILEPFY